jgi:acetyl-CoA carboxylase biotin carboxyl carrier protein
MKLTNEDVKEILELLDATSFDVLDLETGRFKLSLRRNRAGEWSQESQVLAPATLTKSLEPAPAASAAVTPQSLSADAGAVAVRATLPGTFYRAPRPGADPFVQKGSAVEADTVVGIIETMKLMTAVHAGVRGTIAEIAVENAQFADQGTVLMTIKPEPA